MEEKGNERECERGNETGHVSSQQALTYLTPVVRHGRGSERGARCAVSQHVSVLLTRYPATAHIHTHSHPLTAATCSTRSRQFSNFTSERVKERMEKKFPFSKKPVLEFLPLDVEQQGREKKCPVFQSAKDRGKKQSTA